MLPPAPWGETNARRRTLLYIGRLHPKKNLASLIEAFAGIKRSGRAPEWQLVIAGWSQLGYERMLHDLARTLSIEHCVFFLGPVFGEQKRAALFNASAFVLPSLSEGLPVAVLEAWAHGLPVAMTEHCNLDVGFATDSAFKISSDMIDMQRGLDQFLAWSVDDMTKMGSRGRSLARDTFSWEQVTSQFERAYQCALDGHLRHARFGAEEP
jgi:poly(glycerol-phosphate) alpha-glucosyltransferase